MSERLAALKLEGQVTWLGWAPGGSFVSEPAERLDLTYAGIEGDRHAGLTRKSGAREPWYPRGTPMRNERQLSLLGAEELADVAAAMGMAVLEPAWIGGNLVLAGIPDFSRLPPRTILMFPWGILGQDPAIAPDAHLFRPDREERRTHAAFAMGGHMCLGHFIARAQIAEGLHQIARRITRPTTSGPRGWRVFTGVWGISGLPIEFEPA